MVTAPESRTSAPVRIPRTKELHHTELTNLYPCGEGAGFAGGIISAALDGVRVVKAIGQKNEAQSDVHSILIKVDTSTVNIRVDDVIQLEPLGDYVGFYTSEKRYVVKVTLVYIE